MLDVIMGNALAPSPNDVLVVDIPSPISNLNHIKVISFEGSDRAKVTHAES